MTDIEKLVEECGEALCALIYKEGAWATIDAEDRRLYLRDARAVIRRTLEQLAYTGAISLASIDEGATRPETWKERAENRQAVFLLAKRRAEAAESEAAALREALRPFAKAASDYERQGEFFSNNIELVLRVSVFAAPEYHNSTAVQVGDLRRARTALEGRDNG